MAAARWSNSEILSLIDLCAAPIQIMPLMDAAYVDSWPASLELLKLSSAWHDHIKRLLLRGTLQPDFPEQRESSSQDFQ
jgi:hypothetical protein